MLSAVLAGRDRVPKCRQASYGVFLVGEGGREEVSVFGVVGGDMDVGNQEWIGEDRGMGGRGWVSHS